VSREITEFNPETGETEIYHEDGDTFAVEQVQDVEPILEANKLRRNENPTGSDALLDADYRKQEWRHVARIPMIWLLKLNREEGLDFQNPEHMKVITKRYLNSNEYSSFRTSSGKL
jgi:hypothetical protein